MSEAPITDERVPPDLKVARGKKAGFSTEAKPFDKLPPHSPEAEQGVLGSIFLSPIDAMAKCVSRFKPGANVMYDLRHHNLFQTFLEMYDDEVPIDVITVHDRLKLLGKLDQVGGLEYIASLPDTVPSAGNLEFYLEIVLEKYALRTLVQSCTEIVGRVYSHSGDAASLLSELEAQVMAMARNLQGGADVSIKEYVDKATTLIEGRYAPPDVTRGLPTGIPDLDRLLIGGFKGSEFIVIAARPSEGKTSLAMNFVEVIGLEHKLPVGVISLEMEGEKLVERMMLSRAQIDPNRIIEAAAGRDFPIIAGVAGKLNNSPIHIYDQVGMNITQVCSKVRQMFYQHGIRLFVVDYLQLVHGNDRRKQRNEQVSEISKGIKNLCRELKIPGIILAQLNRDIEKDKGRRPRLSDLRESGDIEQDADAVIFIHNATQDEDANPNESVDHPVDLILAKRRNGPKGTVGTIFQPAFTRFIPRAKVTDADVPPEHQQQSFYHD